MGAWILELTSEKDLSQPFVSSSVNESPDRDRAAGVAEGRGGKDRLTPARFSRISSGAALDNSAVVQGFDEGSCAVPAGFGC